MSNLKKLFTIGVSALTVLWSVGVSFAPLTVSAAASAGDLIKMAGNPAVYYFDGSKRYVFPNSTTYFTWYKDFSGVKTIPASELQSYAIGGNVTVRPGTKLVKITTDPKVYAISYGGVLHAIDSETRAATLYGSSWNKMVVDVPDAFFVNYKSGTAISSDQHVDGTLIKYSGSSTYYIVEGGKKRAFASDAALAANMIDTSYAVTTSVSYADGTSITGKETNLTNVAGSSAASTYVPGQGTGLSVALASDTPAAVTIADGSAFNNMLKVNFTAGSDGPVSITGLTVTKGGFLGNTLVTGVSAYDAAGKRHGNVVTTLGSDGVATLGFVSDPIVIPAGTTSAVYIKANIDSSANSGTVNFSIASAAAVTTASTATVSGTFPVTGNTMTVVDGASSLAAVKVDEEPVNVSGIQLNVDANSEQDIAKFRLQVTNSNEAVKLYSLTLWNNGTAADTDLKDVQLVDPTGTVLATAQSVGKNVVFDLSSSPYFVDKGQQKDFTVRAKIVNGAARTVQFVIYNDYDTDVRGVTTGASILPEGGSNDPTFPIGNSSTSYNTVTIGSGTLTLVRDSASSSAAITPGATNVELAKFDIQPYGEDMELRQISFGIDQNGNSGTALTGTVSVKIDGSTVYSADASTFAKNGDAATKTLSSYPILKAGVQSVLTVEANVSSSATTSDSYYVNDMNLILVKRVVTNDLYTPTTSAIDGLTRNVQGAKLTVTTLATPVATSVVAGTNGFELARIELSASGSGESVKVSKLVVTDTLGNGGSDYSGVNNLMMYNASDLNTALQTSSSTNTNGATVSFNFTNPITVTSSTPVTLVLKGNIVSATGTSHKYYVLTTGDHTLQVTATGLTTGNTVATGNITIQGAGQVMTVATGGTLTGSVVTGTGATPSIAQLVNVGTSNSTYFAFKLTSQYEAQKITSLTLHATGTSLHQNDLVNLALYEQVGNGTIASTPFATAAQFSTCSSNTCSFNWTASDNLLSQAIQPGNFTTIYVKADVGGTGTSKLGDDFYLSLDMTTGTDITAKGVNTGTAPTYAGGNLNSSGAKSYIVPFSVLVEGSYPTAGSSTTQTIGAGSTLGRFKVTNQGNAPVTLTDITFTDNGSHSGSSARYTLYSSDQGSSNYTGYSIATSSSDSLAFTGLSSANLTINGGSFRYLTVTLSDATGVLSGNSFSLSVASLGDVKYSVAESALGYDGTQNGTLSDPINGLLTDGKPSLGSITKQ